MMKVRDKWVFLAAILQDASIILAKEKVYTGHEERSLN
jgi:hypothetical protein